MTRNILVAVIAIGLAGSLGFAQSSFDTSPETQGGEKPLGSYFATDIDTVSMSNGNLHLSIPLISLPGRELPLRLSMDYNSKLFEPRQIPAAGGGTTTTYDFMGWRKDTALGGILSITQHICGWDDVDLYWMEWNGTKHQFPTKVIPCVNGSRSINNLTFDSNESDVIRAETGDYFNNPIVTSQSGDTGWGKGTIRFKNGHQLFLYQRQLGTIIEYDDNGNPLYSNLVQQYKWESRTLNGNTLTATDATQSTNQNGTGLRDGIPLSDTGGRSITYSKTANTETITVLDSNNQSKIYTINWTAVPARSPADDLDITARVVQSMVLPNGRSYQFTYNPTGYLDRVTFPSGAYIRYTYWRKCLNSGWYVVSRIVSADGTAASEKVTTYNYYTGAADDACPFPMAAGPVVRTTVTDPVGGKTVHYFDGNGMENKTENQTSSGTVVRQQSRSYQHRTAGYVVSSEYAQQGSFTLWGNGYEYDDWLNVTRIYESQQGTPIRQIDRTFVTSTEFTNQHIWDRVASESISPNWLEWQDNTATYVVVTGAAVARTEWQYDQLSLVARSGTIPGWVNPDVCSWVYNPTTDMNEWVCTNRRANVTAVRKWLSGTTFFVTSQQYDVLGNLVNTTDPGSHVTQIDFNDRFTDSISRNSFAYPTKVTDPGGFYKQSTYDFNTGLVKQATDSLSRVTATTYDLMNRTTQINYPDGGQTNYSYDDVTPLTTETKKVDNAGNVGRVTFTFDKLYRVVSTRTADPAGDIYVDTQYDSKGRKSQVSNPYRTGETVAWTTYAYDLLDRPTVTTKPDGSTLQYTYTNNQTTVTDEAGNQRRYTYDRYNQLLQVDEPNPTLSSSLTTTYTYSILGKMKQSNQSGQVRTWVFDSLNRLISQTLPESGTTTFSYNVDSLLTSKIDARSITMTYSYNSVHKPTSQTYSDSTPAVTLQYDAANRRSQMTDALGTVTYQYDTKDRLTQEQRTLTGITGTFTTAYVYNYKGDMTQMTYPSGRVVNFNYATGGGCCDSRLASVADQTTGTTLANSISYNPAGEITSRTLGSGVIETFAFNNRLQETGISATLSGDSLMNFSYNYGTNTTNTGRVLSRTDSIQPEHSANYTYDSLYRLTQAVAPDSSWDISWTFDVWGNRLSQTPQGLAATKVGTQRIGYSNINNIPDNRNASFSYDAAGNQLNDGLHNYSFTAENQIIQMDGGAATYAYDGEGRRMKKTYNGETTYTFYDSKGNVMSEFTTSNAIASATAASSTDKSFYHTTDKLGSTVLVINSGGTVIENNRTLPYGEAWLAESTPSTNGTKFTSYQRDSESGLDYTLHRYYQSSTGRFGSPDLFLADIGGEQPQRLNRYLYVTNNPANLVDPDGQEPEDSAAHFNVFLEIFKLATAVTSPSPLDQAPTFGIGVVTRANPIRVVFRSPNPTDVPSTPDGKPDDTSQPPVSVCTTNDDGTTQCSQASDPNPSASSTNRLSRMGRVGDYLGCVGGQLVGNGGIVRMTVVINVAWAIAETSAGALLPGPGWLYTATAVVWDVGIVAVAVNACK